MNDLLNDWKNLAIGLLGVLVGILTWIGKRTITRVDQLAIEAIARNVEFQQLRGDLAEEHSENGDKLDRIEALINRNHEDATQGRHRVGNQILTLAGQVAKLEGRLEEFKR